MHVFILFKNNWKKYQKNYVKINLIIIILIIKISSI